MAPLDRARRQSPVLLLPAFFACGGGEGHPEAEFSRARLAVERAIAAGAGEGAANELTRAPNQLTAAREAAVSWRYAEARRLAERAGYDGTLAEARAEAEVASERLDQLPSTGSEPRRFVLPSPSLSAAPAAIPR